MELLSLTEEQGPLAVYVSGLTESATEASVREFFSFCGTVSAFGMGPNAADGSDGAQHAVIVFSSPSAWQTALLLTNARIADGAITVAAYETAFPDAEYATDAVAAEPEAAAAAAETTEAGNDEAPDAEAGSSSAESGPIVQEAKSKTAIMAELTASGYMLGANTLSKARKFDEEHFNLGLRMQVGVAAAKNKAAAVDSALGISSTVDAAVKTTGAAVTAVDQKLGVSTTVAAASSATVDAATAVGTTVAAMPGVKHGVDFLVGVSKAIGSTVTSYTNATASEIEQRRLTESESAASSSSDPPAPKQAEY